MRKTRRWLPPILGALATLLWLSLGATSAWYGNLRERALDAIALRLTTTEPRFDPVVIDIDRRTLSAWGMKRIRADRLAELLETLAAAHPRVIGIDILLERAVEASRRPSDAPGLAPGDAAEADRRLAAAIGKAKMVLGLALDPDDASHAPDIATTPVLILGRPERLDLWETRGLIAPFSDAATAAAGLGVQVASADADALVRRVPLLAIGARRIVPGLAVEMLRVAEEASTLVISAEPLALQIGSLSVPLAENGLLRLAPEPPERRAGRIVSALDAAAGAARFADQIVLVGSSAPELGGLRPGSGSELVAGVELHAAAVAQIRAGSSPRRTAAMQRAEGWASLAAGLAFAGITALLPPVTGLLVSGAAILVMVCAAALGYARYHWLIDPLALPIAVVIATASTAFAVAADTWRRRAALERTLAQRLPADVARRISLEPSLLKLEGETRTITALFTDIEDFTAMTDRAAPDILVKLLDRYFDGVSSIVIEHGGMIDKFVGDAVHAFFNAPLDVVDHPREAVRAAIKIADFSTAFRAIPEARDLGFGRTRIGIETGAAIVGDVGGGRKLDYTAHGNAVNAAARLEGMNKVLATTICVGPGTATLLPEGMVRPVGTVMLRGRREPQVVFEPWPRAFDEADRRNYQAAVALAAADVQAAAALFGALAARHPQDAVTVALARSPDRLHRPI